MAHRYRVTLDELDAAPDAGRSISTEVTNHDDLFDIIDRVGARGILPANEVTEFAIGLKLFGEMVLRHRRDPLFEAFLPHFGAFMKVLKSSGTVEKD